MNMRKFMAVLDWFLMIGMCLVLGFATSCNTAQGQEVVPVNVKGWVRVVNSKTPLYVSIAGDVRDSAVSVRFSVRMVVNSGDIASRTYTVTAPDGYRVYAESVNIEGVSSNDKQQMLLHINMKQPPSVTGDVKAPSHRVMVPYQGQGRFGLNNVIRGQLGRYIDFHLWRDGDTSTAPAATVTVIGRLEKGE